MTKTGIIAAAFGLLACVLVFVAVSTREMGAGNFIIGAYVVTIATLVLYVWSVAGRLARAREEK